jgi:REP element-mobilizing transposase RayT
MRRAKGLPSFRSERIHNLLRDAVRDTHRRLSGFRIVEYSIQADHLHLIVEADDRALLSTGVRSFSVRVAMRINKQIFGRTRGKGKVWGDRYHRRDLPTPPEVRNALVYVLNNAVKHGELRAGSIDPYSSAPWFSGWIDGRGPPEGAPDSVAEQAQCWLLTDGWPKVFPGFLHVQETPKARAHR